MYPVQITSNLWDILELCISIVISLLLIGSRTKCSLFLLVFKVNINGSPKEGNISNEIISS